MYTHVVQYTHARTLDEIVAYTCDIQPPCCSPIPVKARKFAFVSRAVLVCKVQSQHLLLVTKINSAGLSDDVSS